ncbi:MAG: FtsX-like permease family protein [Parasphingorhabdus sp.]|nr:FtsX-like permease family protein [Parasphingorhabdus sp.]
MLIPPGRYAIRRSALRPDEDAMLNLFAIPAHDKRLIPEGRLTGPMPWVIAIMIFLTVLAAAAGLALGEGAARVGDELGSQISVQILEANPATRNAQRTAVAARLRGLTGVASVRALSDQETTSLIEPWLGSKILGTEIPIPALIDVTLTRAASTQDIARIERAIAPLAPTARVEQSASYVAPVTRLVRSLQWIAAGLVALLGIATAAAVIISARSALNTHNDTIDVIHLLGGTDRQITRLFQRRIALDALLGGIVGLFGGLAIIWLIGGQISDLGSGLAGTIGLSWFSWIIILCVPLLGTALAMLTARLTVLRALRRSL